MLNSPKKENWGGPEGATLKNIRHRNFNDSYFNLLRKNHNVSSSCGGGRWGRWCAKTKTGTSQICTCCFAIQTILITDCVSTDVASGDSCTLTCSATGYSGTRARLCTAGSFAALVPPTCTANIAWYIEDIMCTNRDPTRIEYVRFLLRYVFQKQTEEKQVELKFVFVQTRRTM